MPFDLHINSLTISNLTKEEIYEEFKKDMNSTKSGKSYSKEEVRKMLLEQFGIENLE